MTMTAEQFIEWRESLGITRAAAAQLIGISPNGYTRYENGTPIPRHIALACNAIAHDLGPWQKGGVPAQTLAKTRKHYLAQGYADKRFSGSGKTPSPKVTRQIVAAE